VTTPRPASSSTSASRAEDWQAFAAHTLEDYTPAEGDGWTVLLPTELATTWRIREDDAGVWYVL
jgi:hypothetical protein